MILRLTSKAEADLERIASYLSGTIAGESFVDRFEDALGQLKAFPLSGRLERRLGSDRRVLYLGPFILSYTVNEEEIVIRRIKHGARKNPFQANPPCDSAWGPTLAPSFALLHS
jgi:plasmid stabilization system protein ParE